MKKYLFAAFLFGNAFLGYTQMVLSSGSQIVVSSGSVLVANDITGSGGTIKNLGDVSVLGDITNNSGALFDAASNGTVTFEGSSAQKVTGTSSITFYGTLDIDNSSGVSLTDDATGASQTIDGTLNFTNGLLTLNAFDLTVGSTDPTGVGTTKYIKTNSTGVVKRTVGSSDVVFPVGNSAYNPIILNNSGTSDTYGVKVTDNEPANSSTVHMVDRSWTVTESVSGGSDLAVTTQWIGTEELSGFDRTKSNVGLTTDNGSSYTWGSVGAASGSDPYTRQGTGFTGVGTFATGDYYYGGIEIDLQAFLAAAYNTTNDNMDKTLNTAGLLPTTDPYSLNTTVSSVPANAVDWVKIQLRDPSNSATVLYSFARFIDQTGQVIEEDGSNFTMTGVTSGSYYVAILHRNHFGVMSNSTIDLSGSPTLSFKSAQATAWQDGSISTNSAMKEVETGVFAMWEGDATGDGTIKYNGTGNDKNEILGVVGLSTPNNIVNSYSASDINMDGDVKYNGTSNDKNEVLGVVGLSTPNDIKNEHLPN